MKHTWAGSASPPPPGLWSYDVPADVGGPGLTRLQQVLVTEQRGRITNALAWVVPTPASWWVGHATPYHLETWLLRAVREDRRECYAVIGGAPGRTSLRSAHARPAAGAATASTA